jgi:hypothetical protein
MAFTYATKPPQPYDQVEREEAEKVKGTRRVGWDIENGLRASAHLGDTAEYRAMSRLLADDMYEHLTGNKLDEGHQKAQKFAVREAFRSTRGKQEEHRWKLKDVMRAYGVNKEEAYKLIDEGLPAVPKAREMKLTPVPVSLTEEEVEARILASQAQEEHRKRLKEEERAKELEEEGRRAEAERARAEAEAHAEREQEKKAEVKEVPLTKAQKKKLKKEQEKAKETDWLAEAQQANAIASVEAQKKRTEEGYKSFIKLERADLSIRVSQRRDALEALEFLESSLKKINAGKVIQRDDGAIMTKEICDELIADLTKEIEGIDLVIDLKESKIKGYEMMLTGKGKTPLRGLLHEKRLLEDEIARVVDSLDYVRGEMNDTSDEYHIAKNKGNTSKAEMLKKDWFRMKESADEIQRDLGALKQKMEVMEYRKGGPLLEGRHGRGRKPYLGKVMKQKLLDAVGGSRNLFNKAKRGYKSGMSFEEVLAQASSK